MRKAYRLPACLFLFLIPLSQLLAQHTPLVEAHLASVEAFLLAGELSCAEQELNRLHEVAFCHDDLAFWINACKQGGKICRDKLGDARLANAYLGRALQDKLWRSPATAKEWDALGWLYVNLGYNYNIELLQVEEAAQYYEHARGILVDTLGTEDFEVGNYLYRPLGNIYNKLGDLASASVLLQRYKDICVKEGETLAAAKACNDLGLVHVSAGDFDTAIALFEEGVQASGEDRFNKGMLLSNLASAWHSRGDHRMAKAIALDAERELGAAYGEGQGRAGIYLAMNRETLVYISEALGEKALADGYFASGMALFAELYPDRQSRQAVKFLVKWSGIQHARGQHEAALTHAQRALSYMTGVAADKAAQNPSADQLMAENTIEDALKAKSNALKGRYANSRSMADLKLALGCWELAFEVNKLLRNAYNNELAKLANLERLYEDTEQAVALALAIAEAGGGDAYRYKAFEFAERSKGILLLEALQGNSAARAGRAPDSVREEERALKADIAATEEALFEARTAQAPDSLLQALEGDLLLQRQAHKAWEKALEKRFPKYYDLKHNTESATVADVQRRLLSSGDEALLAYFPGDSLVYAFVITQQSYAVLRLPDAKGIAQQIRDMHGAITAFQQGDADRALLCEAYTRQAQQLYQQLVAPLDRALPLPSQLTIIPSGVFALLPFEALLTASPAASCDFRKYPYWLYEKTISYGYSATLQARLRDYKPKGRGFAGFAPAFTGQEKGMGTLRYNRAVIQGVGAKSTGGLFLDREATIANFKSRAPEMGTIHLGTHAQANTESGNFSFVVFSDGQGGYDSLFVNDIQLMELQADMVVLSACETAIGTIYRGEGTISLARSFLYAGARSVMTTLWSIDDVANRDIMLDFYAFHQNGGRSKAAALRDAKLGHLNRSDRYNAHPVYWAAFVSMGDMGGGRSWAWAVGLGLLVVGLGAYWWRRGRIGRWPSRLSSGAAGAG